jgi:hypothetical protein
MRLGRACHCQASLVAVMTHRPVLYLIRRFGDYSGRLGTRRRGLPPKRTGVIFPQPYWSGSLFLHMAAHHR